MRLIRALSEFVKFFFYFFCDGDFPTAPQKLSAPHRGATASTPKGCLITAVGERSVAHG